MGEEGENYPFFISESTKGWTYHLCPTNLVHIWQRNFRKGLYVFPKSSEVELQLIWCNFFVLSELWLLIHCIKVVLKSGLCVPQLLTNSIRFGKLLYLCGQLSSRWLLAVLFESSIFFCISNISWQLISCLLSGCRENLRGVNGARGPLSCHGQSSKSYQEIWGRTVVFWQQPLENNYRRGSRLEWWRQYVYLWKRHLDILNIKNKIWKKFLTSFSCHKHY